MDSNGPLHLRFTAFLDAAFQLARGRLEHSSVEEVEDII
jgi:hypothetical protein